jgi:antitoxin (DNA-binding transcriptional repressor) of toxin-antitoxin stability system
MDAVAETGASIVITKRGTPVARLVPAADPPNSVFGFAKGSFEEIGDLISPATSEWRPDDNELKRIKGNASHPTRRPRRAKFHPR